MTLDEQVAELYTLTPCLFGHNWERVSDCMNGPHLWQCKVCKEWTRSYDQPEPN